MQGPIVLFGSTCFLVFAVVYLTLVGSTYLFLSNLVFGGLGALSWLGCRWRLPEALLASLFPAAVPGVLRPPLHPGIDGDHGPGR